MKKAIALAWQGIDTVYPNPPVGALVVKDGKILGRGWHKAHGGPHAEVFALEQAGADARGASLYVSLEPCNHYGKTPPCVQAILQAGIKKVFFSCSDPNPLVQGGGAHALREAGVEVFSGLNLELGEELLLPWKTRVLSKSPFQAVLLGGTLSGSFFSLHQQETRSSLSVIAQRRITKIQKRFLREGGLRIPRREEFDSAEVFEGIQRVYLVLVPEFNHSEGVFLQSAPTPVFCKPVLLHQQRLGREILAIYAT